METTATRKQLMSVGPIAAIGSYFEYYDFFIALFAAGVVWPSVFFKNASPGIALSLSILSYALTFFSRPVGAFIFGHLGDKVGRKKLLYWTMILMGIGTFGVAALPGVSVIGAAAPIILGLLRLVQGLGLGGEAGGASTWVVEIASKTKRRGYWASWVQTGSPAGLITAALLTYVMEVQTGAAYYAWGWRIPFVIGGIVALIGAIIRFRLSESHVFEKMQEKNLVSRRPAIDTIKKHWKMILLLSFLAFPEIIGTSVQVIPFSIVYMAQIGVPHTFTVFVSVFLGIGAFVGSVVAGFLCDYIGRKPFAIAAGIFAIIVAAPFFMVISLGNETLIAAMLFAWGFGVYLENGILPALFTESFPTQHRYSGSGLGLQFGTLWSGLIVGFLLPVVLASHNGVAANAWPYVAGITMGTGIVTLIAAIIVKETKDVDLDTVGMSPSAEAKGGKKEAAGAK